MGEALEHQPHEIHGQARRSQKRDLHNAAFDGGGFRAGSYDDASAERLAELNSCGADAR